MLYRDRRQTTKLLIAKLSNLLRIKSLTTIQNNIKVDQNLVRLQEMMLDFYDVPNITNVIIQLTQRLGFKTTSTDKELIKHILINRFIIQACHDLLRQNYTYTGKQQNNSQQQNLVQINSQQIKPERFIFYLTTIDLIPDLFYAVLDESIEYLDKRKNPDYVYIVSAINILWFVSNILEATKNAINISNTGKYTLSNFALFVGTSVRYSLLIQYRLKEILGIVNNLQKTSFDIDTLSSFITSDLTSSISNTIQRFSGLARAPIV